MGAYGARGTHFIVDDIRASYSACVASWTNSMTGCSTAASTSPLLISDLSMGHRFCHQSFCKERCREKTIRNRYHYDYNYD